MGVLSDKGLLSFKRDLPPPIQFTRADLNQEKFALESIDTTFWSGDRVIAFCESGLPWLDNPDGRAGWGDDETYPPANSELHVADDLDEAWNHDAEDSWDVQDGSVVTQAEVWVSRDVVGNLSLYASRIDALNGYLNTRLKIQAFDWGALTLTQVDTGEWELVGNVTAWNMETDSPAVDTTAVGKKFGESVKALITASGSLDFFIDRTDQDWDAVRLLNLSLMLNKGAVVRAQLFLISESDSLGCGTQLPGSLFYDLDLLPVNCAVQVNAAELARGSMRFVSTGEVRLRAGSVDWGAGPSALL